MTKTKANIMYAGIEGLYYVCVASVFSFASAYLLDRGFTNGQIGLLQGITSLLAILFQQAIAQFMTHDNIRQVKFVAVLFGSISLCAAILMIFPVRGIVFCLVMGAVLTIMKSIDPSVQSLYRGYNDQGIEIDFARSRGIGSAVFSLSAALIGQLLSSVGVRILPMLYFIPSLLLVIVLLIFNAPNVDMTVQHVGKSNVLKEYPHFKHFLIGIALIATSHNFIETFLLQIIQRIGGNVGNMGTAVAISAITELPAMLLYNRFKDRFGNRKLMIFAGWMWVIKSACLAFAPNVTMIYLAELLQFFSYAIYVPTAAKHIAHTIPASEYLKGQALVGSAFIFGVLTATIIGGQLIDIIGLQKSLIGIQFISLIGILIFTKSVTESMKIIPTKASQNKSK